MMRVWRLTERARWQCLVPALALASIALAAAPGDAAPAASPSAETKCPPSALTGILVSAEKLYQEQQFDSAGIIVRLGLTSCGAGSSDLARLHVLEGMLKIEAFNEEEARAAFAAALALDGNPTLPAFMSPRAQRVFDAVKAVTSPPKKEVKIVEVAGGRVVFAAGTDEGFRPGSKVRVISQRQAKSAPAAVLRVVQAQLHTAVAELGRGDQVQKGDVVVPTDEPLSEQIFFPRRAAFTSRIGFRVRPMVTATSFGAIGHGYYSYYFKNLPISLQAELGPVGATSRQGAGDASLTAAFETDFFAIGLGAGGGKDSQRSGFTINQTLRLGSLDGLKLSLESSELYTFGLAGLAFRAELDVPVASRFSVFADSGLRVGTDGGGSLLAFGELGFRMYWIGSGAPGTLILSVSGGFAELYLSTTEFGPLMGFGLEWRL